MWAKGERERTLGDVVMAPHVCLAPDHGDPQLGAIPGMGYFNVLGIFCPDERATYWGRDLSCAPVSDP